MSESNVLSKLVVVEGLPLDLGDRASTFASFLQQRVAKLLNIEKNLVSVKVVSVKVVSEPSGHNSLAFLDFIKTSDATRATEHLKHYSVSKVTALTAHKWETWKRTLELPETYSPPAVEDKMTEASFINTMMLDPEAKPEFLIKSGEGDVAIMAFQWRTNNVRLVTRRKPKEWSEVDVAEPKTANRIATPMPMWSPLGTYLITEHLDGVKLWSGPQFATQTVINEPEAQCIQVSPSEQYMVIKTAADVSLWSIRQGKKLRSLHGLEIDVDSWPVMRFNADDTLSAVVRHGQLVVFDTATMRLIPGDDKRSSYGKGDIVDVRWSPTNPLQLSITAEDHLGPRVEIGNVEIEYDEEGYSEPMATHLTFAPLIRRNFTTAKEVGVLWHPLGSFAAAKVTLKKQQTIEYCMFRVKPLMASAEQLTIQGSAIRFNWQPQGNYFAVIVEKKDGQNRLEVFDMLAKPKIRLLGSVVTNGFSFLWSSKSPRIALLNFDKSLVELHGIDVEKQTLISFGRRDHPFCNHAEWDASGRFLVTWDSVNETRGRSETKYVVSDMNGQVLFEGKVNRLQHLSFRPAAPLTLSEAQVAAIEKALPEYIRQCRESDETVRKRQQEAKEKWEAKRAQEFCEIMDKIWRYQESQGYVAQRAALEASSPSAIRRMNMDLGTVVEKVKVEEIIERRVLESKT